MNIREFVFNLQKIYDEMGETFSSYQRSVGLGCPSGCGQCCLNPEVEASTLEMLPMALKIYDDGKLEEWLERLEQNTISHCLIFNYQGGRKGQCISYYERPSLCRMFGVSGFLNKQGEITVSICKLLKEDYPETYQTIKEQKPTDIPKLRDWSLHLSTIHPELIHKRIPINDALKEALNKIALYAQYYEI